jgi:hypothetical protein
VHHHQRRDGLWLGAPFSLTPRRVILVDDQVALSARVAGTYTLSCVYQDLHVQGSPFKVTVRAHSACAATSSLVTAPSDTVGGTTATVRVLARDAFGNTTTSGGLSAHGSRSTWGSPRTVCCVVISGHYFNGGRSTDGNPSPILRVV